jgi:preprotein translocase YajC subunit
MIAQVRLAESGAGGSSLRVHFFVDACGQPWLIAQAEAPGGFDLFGGMAIPLAFTLVLFYLLLMRPEQKKRKEMEKLLAGVKKNDHVVTIGGIYGTVVAATTGSKFVTIRVDDSTGAKVKVLRSAISQIGAVDDAETEAKAGD